MLGLFFLSVVTVFGAICFYFNTSGEMPRVLSVLAAIAGFLGLMVFAPWQVKIVTIVLILNVARRFSHSI